MRIRIECDEVNVLIDDIRQRASKREWNTWNTVDVKLPDVNIVKRLTHVPPGDDQYECVKVKLCTRSDGEKKKGVRYVDLIPVVTDATLTTKQKSEKKGIVLGRFCEVLNRYFPTLAVYHVLLKK